MGVNQIGSPRASIRSRQRPQTVFIESNLNNNLKDKQFSSIDELDDTKKIIKNKKINFLNFKKSDRQKSLSFENLSKDKPPILNKSTVYDIKNRFKKPEIINSLSNTDRFKIGQTSPKFCTKGNSFINIPSFDETDPNANKSDELFQITNFTTTTNVLSDDRDLTNANYNNLVQEKSHKIVITKYLKSDKKFDNCFDDKSKKPPPVTPTKGKKSNNCRIYGFIPKCTKRNDSSESRDLSEETNNNSSYTNNINNFTARNKFLNMDRSVDSIGSCSLDVDADSTDFSGTKILVEEKLNFFIIFLEEKKKSPFKMCFLYCPGLIIHIYQSFYFYLLFCQ